jgi:hypothetical protein
MVRNHMSTQERTTNAGTLQMVSVREDRHVSLCMEQLKAEVAKEAKERIRKEGIQKERIRQRTSINSNHQPLITQQ